jgi:hypothetical protein
MSVHSLSAQQQENIIANGNLQTLWIKHDARETRKAYYFFLLLDL